MMMFAALRTHGGYLNSEVTSAMQKCIRRGDEDGALFWATELDVSNYGEYVWKRLRIIASEDIGLADAQVCVQIRTLYENWQQARKDAQRDRRPIAGRIFLVHAVLICVRAKKSRMADTAQAVYYSGDRPTREIPEQALDMAYRTRAQNGTRRGSLLYRRGKDRQYHQVWAVPRSL
jgi:replication-associated recombination protein RarA